MKLIFAAIFLMALFNALTMIAAQFQPDELPNFPDAPPKVIVRKSKPGKTRVKVNPQIKWPTCNENRTVFCLPG